MNFWDKIEYRCATAFTKNFHIVPQSSLSEAAQAFMKATHENNISLVHAVYADISYSARLDAKWLN